MSQVSKHIQVSEDNVEIFHKTYGEQASLSWLVDELLTQYFKEIGEKSPKYYAELAAKALKEIHNDNQA